MIAQLSQLAFDQHARDAGLGHGVSLRVSADAAEERLADGQAGDVVACEVDVCVVEGTAREGRGTVASDTVGEG